MAKRIKGTLHDNQRLSYECVNLDCDDATLQYKQGRNYRQPKMLYTINIYWYTLKLDDSCHKLRRAMGVRGHTGKQATTGDDRERTTNKPVWFL